MILCFGDSLTEGFGVPTPASYPSRLQQRLQQEGFRHRVINAGISGDTTQGALSRLPWLLQKHPKITIAIVTLGANDGLWGMELTSMQNNLEAIIKQLLAHDTEILLGGMQIPTDHSEDYAVDFSKVYPHLAARHKLPLIPFFLSGVANNPHLTLSDCLHPNANGYEVVFENVWKHLLPMLEG